MMGSLADYSALIDALARYESAERLAQIFPDVEALGIQADRRHAALFGTAMDCGFDPARPNTPTSLEWARARVAAFALAFPNHARTHS